MNELAITRRLYQWGLRSNLDDNRPRKPTCKTSTLYINTFNNIIRRVFICFFCSRSFSFSPKTNHYFVKRKRISLEFLHFHFHLWPFSILRADFCCLISDAMTWARRGFYTTPSTMSRQTNNWTNANWINKHQMTNGRIGKITAFYALIAITSISIHLIHMQL